MTHFFIVLFSLLGMVLVSWAWVKGIDDMKENHPKYTGDDFLNCDDVTKSSGRDSWDDNKVHTDYEV